MRVFRALEGDGSSACGGQPPWSSGRNGFSQAATRSSVAGMEFF